MKQTIIKSLKWWKKPSALECGLTIAAVCAVLVQNAESRKLNHMSTEALFGAPVAKKVPQVVEKTTNGEICVSQGCVDAASSVLENMDPRVDPCDDFYRFACGSFLKNTIIPDDKTSVNTFSIIIDKLQKQLRSSIEEESKHNDPRPFKLLKTLYKTCMNKTHIEKEGLNPLHRVLKELGGWPVLLGDTWSDDDFNWKESVYKFFKKGYSMDLFISFGISVDLKNSSKRVIELDEAELGLSREYLLKGMENRIVSAYYNFMVDIAEILGADRERATRELRESLDFEMKLANISLPSEKRRNSTAMYNLMTVRELTQKFPSIPWLEYFSNLLPSSISVTEDEPVIVRVPSFITDLERLLEHTPKRVQANYVMWRATGDSISYLNDEIRERELGYITDISGVTEQEPRWKECVDIVSGSLSISAGALYVRKYFNEDAKNNAVEMVSDILREFKNILEQVDWMDVETRKAALDKANSMSTHIAFPDELLDDNKLEEFHEKLDIKPGNYFESMLNLTLFGTQYSFEKLRKPVNKSDWINHGMSAIVNAFYSPTKNSINFPAGILQGAFFSNDRPRYMNYGAIGFAMGHEITHGFDDQGRQFDKDGNLVDWWAAETKEKYLKRAECIINQYSNYTVPEVGLNLNGINTQGENIADNGGIKEAYLAYKEWVRRNGPEPLLPGLDYITAQQMFWISAANTWCSKQRAEMLKLDILTDVHSPGEFRVLGPLSNMEEFAKDFKCPLGSRMNPEKKCTVW